MEAAMIRIKPVVVFLSCIAGVVTICGCGGKSPTQPSTNTPVATQDPSLTPRSLAIGQTIRGVVTSQDPNCAFTIAGDGWGGLCDQFVVTPSTTGVLTLKVTAASLAIFFKSDDGAQIDMMCCGSPAGLSAFVETGLNYWVELAYVGRPAGYPQIAPVEYTLESTLSNASGVRGSIGAIVFGDETRTQRLSAVRIEVQDGPDAGTVARFEEETGLHLLEGLSPGYVNVRVSSDAFNSSNERLPVGASTPRQLVLLRRQPLPDTSGRLGGGAWANATSESLAYTGVKIEIVDGPLAGVFTFTDDGFGFYDFNGLPPGTIQVRASRRGLRSQTLSVTVAGRTNLDFHMDPQ
jgi:hypothetical protein